MDKTYQIGVVFHKEKEGGYSVTVPTLPGCVSQGDTFEEAQSNIIEAIALYVEGEDIEVLLGEGESEVYSQVQVPLAAGA